VLVKIVLFSTTQHPLSIYSRPVSLPESHPHYYLLAVLWAHNNTDCNTGNNIERENIRNGTGGKPLCQECKNRS